MDQPELNRVVDAWIAGHETEDGTPEHARNWWAVSQVINWHLDGEADLLWAFIHIAYKRNLSDRVVSVLAAGPLEDLLAKHGPIFIERVEQLARQDPAFNSLLGGVWQNTMTDEVWERVKAVRRQVW